jgi:hypothetical protein
MEEAKIKNSLHVIVCQVQKFQKYIRTIASLLVSGTDIAVIIC